MRERTRTSWRCGSCGAYLLTIRDLWQGDLFTHPLAGGRRCVTDLEPIEVETLAPSVAQVMAAALVDAPQETVRERREERAAWAEWPVYEEE